MGGLGGVALEEAVKWAVPLGLGAAVAVLGWLKREFIARWWSERRAFHDGLRAMVAGHPAMHAAVHGLADEMALLSQSSRVMLDANTEVGYFESAPDGRNVEINATYARWVGVSKTDLLGFGWLSYVDPEHRDEVRAEWEACRRESRLFQMRYTMIPPRGVAVVVEVTIHPIPQQPPAKRWVGIVRLVP